MSAYRPWDEELEADSRGDVWVKGKLGGWRHTMPDGHACTPQEVVEYGGMFAAAPDMARALFAVLEWDEMQRATPDVGVLSPIAKVRAALAKAGIPLP